MTLSEFALILAVIALVVLWRLELKLNQIVQQVTNINETLGLVEQKAEEIGDSISSVAVNIATRK